MKVIEQFHAELGKSRPEIDLALLEIKKSIEDESCKATAKRALIITVIFTPEDDRSTAHYNTTVKTSLPPRQAFASSVVTGKKPDNGEVPLFQDQPAEEDQEEGENGE